MIGGDQAVPAPPACYNLITRRTEGRMPTPFPGMDPYLEQPDLWPDLHNSLIVALRDELAPRLRPRYYVAIKERTYTVEPADLVLAGRADVAVVRPERAQSPDAPALPSSADGAVIVEVELPDLIRETYLEVRAAADGQIITLIAILSPTNKRPGEGRGQYLRKRRAVLGSLTYLVEIDLLCGGEPMPVQRWWGRSDYRIMVSRGEQRPRALAPLQRPPAHPPAPATPRRWRPGANGRAWPAAARALRARRLRSSPALRGRGRPAARR